ncbi:hypothetical protein AB1N83_004359 [Pleurotus pulmonarius]
MLSLCSTLLKKLSLKRVSTWEECRIDETSESSVLTLEALSNLSLERVDHVAIKAALVSGICLDYTAIRFLKVGRIASTRSISIPYSILRRFPQGHAALLDSSIWLKGCILNLPFPELLSRLTLDISSHVAYSDFYFPQPADFEPLSTSLASLRDSGMLKRIRINVVVTVYRDIHNVPIDISRTGDVRKIRDGFVPILGPGVDVEVVLNSPRITEYPLYDVLLVRRDTLEPLSLFKTCTSSSLIAANTLAEDHPLYHVPIFLLNAYSSSLSHTHRRFLSFPSLTYPLHPSPCPPSPIPSSRHLTPSRLVSWDALHPLKNAGSESRRWRLELRVSGKTETAEKSMFRVRE